MRAGAFSAQSLKVFKAPLAQNSVLAQIRDKLARGEVLREVQREDDARRSQDEDPHRRAEVRRHDAGGLRHTASHRSPCCPVSMKENMNFR